MVSQKSESHKECGGTEGIWESFMAHCRAKMGIQITLLALCANLHASMPPTGCTERGGGRETREQQGRREELPQWKEGRILQCSEYWEKRWEGDFKLRRTLAGIEQKWSPTPNMYTTTNLLEYVWIWICLGGKRNCCLDLLATSILLLNIVIGKRSGLLIRHTKPRTLTQRSRDCVLHPPDVPL